MYMRIIRMYVHVHSLPIYLYSFVLLSLLYGRYCLNNRATDCLLLCCPASLRLVHVHVHVLVTTSMPAYQVALDTMSWVMLLCMAQLAASVVHVVEHLSLNVAGSNPTEGSPYMYFLEKGCPTELCFFALGVSWSGYLCTCSPCIHLPGWLLMSS